MGRTLQPEDLIDHYKVIGPLGAGGMGEVYLAHDMKLDRDVALKILPPELVRSEDRMKRFILEARSASSLSHPHIITIYDIGHHAVQSAGQTEAGGEEVHYIAMELVRGKTLHDHIHTEKTDLRTILGYLAQAAEGLSKAHAAGIVHRDLKPGNIMVTNDGYAKVLDFGLAKLTDKGATEADATSAPTEVERTSAGTVVGTAGYMSPEQVQGKNVDHRSDLFSFGCILYETAARRRPFEAESRLDTMHRIVHDSPTPIDEINAAVPAELRRLIRRALAKNPDQRLQSIKDLAIELREIVDEYDTLSVTATSGSGIGQPAIAARRSPLSTSLIAAVAVLGVAGAAFGLWALLGRHGAESADAPPLTSMRMKSLLGDDEVTSAALSGDGRYLAYVKGPAARWSLRVRQVSTGSDAEILAPQAIPIRGVSFSPDGDYLYYLGRDPETPSYSALFEVPSLGGTPRKRLFDVDTALAFSPDGKKAAFVRGEPLANQSHLVIVDLGTNQETVLATLKDPEELHQNRPAWSPDGGRIVALWHSGEGGTRHALVAFDTATGDREFVTDQTSSVISSYMWLPDGSGLMATMPPDPGASFQVLFIPYPRGRTRQVTNDLDSYGDISISSDGRAIAALRTSSESAPWTVSAGENQGPRQIGSRSGEASIGDLLPLDDGSLLFTAVQDQHRQIWRMNADGSGKLALTSLPGWSYTLSPLPGDDGVVFTHFDEPEGTRHVWRIDLQGGGLRRLTEGSGEFLQAVSPDGRSVLFGQDGSTGNEVWRVSLDGGEPEKFLEGSVFADNYSPDGRYLLYRSGEQVEGRHRTRVIVIPAGGGEPVAQFLPPGDARDLEWDLGGAAITYIHGADEVENLWKQPIDGGEPVQLTRFTTGQIIDHEYAPDGSRIALVRSLDGARNLWTVDADGTGPRAVTDFPDGFVFGEAWSRDSKSLFFVQGEIRREVVLLEESRR